MKRGYAIIRDSGRGLYVNYEDFGVEFFDGCDYEVTYTLDQINRHKLWKELKAEGLEGTLEEMILAHFGSCLDQDSFDSYCTERHIRFELFTRIS